MKAIIRTTVFVLVVALMACAKEPRESAPGEFHQPPNPHSMGPGRPNFPGFNTPTPAEMAKLRENVGFDSVTERKILEIARTFNNYMKERIIKVQREELNIREELLKDKPDLKYLQKCIDNKTHVFSEIEMAQIKRDLDTKALLTPAQYENWMEAVSQKMHGRLMPLGNPGMPAPPPGGN